MAHSTIEHRKFIIKSGQLSGKWVARAFHKSPGATRGITHETTGSDRDSAILALTQLIDTEAGEQRGLRRHDDALDFDVPTAQEYAMAIRGSDLTDKQVAMLRAHAASGEQGMTAGELAAVAGYKNQSSANLHYGKCGRLLAEAIDLEAPQVRSGDEKALTGIIASAGPAREDEALVWIMHPELREAVEKVLP